MKQQKKLSEQKIITSIMSNPKYQGKHIVAIAGKVFTAITGDKAAKIFDEQTKKYPGEIPITTYIPKADTLILLVWP